MFCDHSKDVETTKWGAHRWNTWGGTVWTTLQSSEKCLILKMMWMLWFCPSQQNPAYKHFDKHCSPRCSSADRWCQKFSCKFNKFSLEATNVHQMNWSERAAAGGARARLKAEAQSPECFFLRMSSFHSQKIQRATSSRAAEKLSNKMNLFKALKRSAERGTQLVEP